MEVARGRQAGRRGRIPKGGRNQPVRADGPPGPGQLSVSARRRPRRSVPEKAVELEPSNTLANRALATFYLGTRRAAEAEPYLKAVAQADTSAQCAGQARAGRLLRRSMNRRGRRHESARGARDQGRPSRPPTRIAVIDYQRKGARGRQQEIDEVLARSEDVPALLTRRAS